MSLAVSSTYSKSAVFSIISKWLVRKDHQGITVSLSPVRMHWGSPRDVRSALEGPQSILVQTISQNSLANLHSAVSTNSIPGGYLSEDHSQNVQECFTWPMKYTKPFLLPALSWPLLCFIKQQHETAAFPRIFTVVICTAWDFQLPPVQQTAETLERGSMRRQRLLQPLMQNLYLAISPC